MSQKIEAITRQAWKDHFNIKWVIGQTVQALKIYFSYRFPIKKKIHSQPASVSKSDGTPNAC